MAVLAYADALRLLARLRGLEGGLVLVGGQAVNFWAERYMSQNAGLALGAPYTSKDIDFCAGPRVVTECARLLGGRATLAARFDDPTPNTGVVSFLDEGSVERVIDFLEAPFGLTSKELFRLAVPIEVDRADGPPLRFLVMHPVLCLESRCHNVAGLPGYSKPAAINQLIASILFVREFLRELLRADERRAVGKLNERIFRFAYYAPHAADVWLRHGIEVFKAALVDPSLPQAFLDVRYPQMRQQLDARRRKMAQVAASRAGTRG